MSGTAARPIRAGASAIKDRVFYGLAIAGALVLLPFSINNFLQGRIWLGVATNFVILAFALNAIAIFRGRKAPLPAALVFLPALVALPLSVRGQGVVGVLWTYPAMVMFHFVLDRRQANLLNCSLVALVTGMAAVTLPPALTLRSGATLLLTILFANIFSAIVEQLQRQLEEQAIRDPLTGAFNRRQLDAALDAELERRRRHATPTSLLLLDLDHFKRINDELGHGTGDRVLQEAVAAMRSRLRRLDLLFRSGGEEFVVVLPETEAADAAGVAEDLRAGVTEAVALPDRRLTLSAGVAQAKGGDDRESWMRRGDHALYAAKSAGRDRVVVAD
jgi:diguanylate cyclase (GGDEF)-like protein